MIIEVQTRATQQIDIEPEEAFRVLCKTLNMDYVLDEDAKLFVVEERTGNTVYKTSDEAVTRRIDDRGDLFIALRNVAVNMFPNVKFRGEKYIY